jgi:hypothetical protein
VPPQPVSPATAQAALVEAWAADQHTVWEIDWPDAPVGGPLTVETWRAGSGYRYEILESTAPALVGEILIFDGQTAWQYNRFDDPLSRKVMNPRRPYQMHLPLSAASTTSPRLPARKLTSTITRLKRSP